MLCEPYTNRGEEHEAEEIGRSFLVARRDPSVTLDLAEEVLDEVALLVKMTVNISFHCAVGLRRNDGRHGLLLDRFDDFVGVIAFVGDEVLSLGLLDELGGL